MKMTLNRTTLNTLKMLVPAVAIAATINMAPAYAHGPDRASGPSAGQSTDRGSDRRRGRGGRGGHNADPAAKAERIFNKLDTDESGIVTLDEYLVKPLAKAEKKFNRIDTDDDGFVSLEEFLAVGGRGDRHADIDRDELRACMEERLDIDLPEMLDKEDRFNAMDTTGDGFLDIDEVLAHKEAGATEKFNAIDADSDGGITLEELIASLEQRQAIREARRACIEEQEEEDELLGG